MAFHARLTKHNLLKLSKFRALPYATQADDKVLDRRHVDHISDDADKTCPARNAIHVQRNHAIQHDTHLYMSKRQPQVFLPDDRSKLLHGENFLKILSTVLCNSQELENPENAGLCRSSTCHCMSSKRFSSLEERKNCLPETCSARCFLPMTMTDLQTILLCHDWNSSTEKGNSCISNYVKPVSYTGDDILVEGSHCEPQNISTDIISHENHDVTVLKDICCTQALKNNCLEVLTMYCEGTEDSSKKETPQGSGPSREQLMVVERFFANTLPSFLKARQDYRIYHKDIIFENNFWGKNVVSRGISEYVMQMNKVRILTHFKYAHAQCHILKITQHPEDGTVRIRWRISGLPQLKTLQIWKFMPWNYRTNRDSNSEWHDGFSIMTVGTDGLVHKHRVDRVMPDEELQTAKRASLAAKLAIMFGLTPKPSLNDFSSLFMKKTVFAPK